MTKTNPAALYHATFKNPIMRKHQLCIKIRCEVEVEIYPESPQRWRARILATGTRLDVSGPSSAAVKAQVRNLYEAQVTDWAAYDQQQADARALTTPAPPAHIMATSDKPQPLAGCTMERRRRQAHIMATSARPLPLQKQVRAVCGKVVHLRQIVAEQNLEQWLEARRDAGFLTGAEDLITCSQCRIIIAKAEDEYARQTETE